MKPNRRSPFFKLAVAAGPVVLLLSPLAQGQGHRYWAAPVNGAGNRDGTWSTSVVAWSGTSTGLPQTAWDNSHFETANFTSVAGGTVTAVGPIILHRITAGDGGAFIIVGDSLNFGGGAIDVRTGGTGTLAVQADVNTNGTTFSKFGNGNLSLGGKVDSSIFFVTSGTLTLSGNNFVDTAKIDSSGTLVLNGNDTIADYSQTGAVLAGTGTLTVTGGTVLRSSLSGNVISGHLVGSDIAVYGNTAVSGSIGGGTLNVNGGWFSLTGSATNSSIINSNGYFSTNGGLGSATQFANEGILELNANETIATYTQGANAFLTGPGTLTASQGAILHGGQLMGHLIADIVSDGDHVIVASTGTIDGNLLSITRGELLLTGTSGHSKVEIAKGASLLNWGSLSQTAEVTNAGLFDGSSVSQVVGSFTNSGTVFGGPLIVTGATVFNGGDLIGTLVADGGATLNDGTRIYGDLLGDTVTHGNVLIYGSTSEGVLRVNDGHLTLEGAASNGLVIISRGASLTVAEMPTGSPHLGDTSLVSNSGTLTVKTAEVIGNLFNEGGEVKGTAHLTALGAATFNGGDLTGELTTTYESTFNDGTSVTGTFHGEATTHGYVFISGTVDGGNLWVGSGNLHLTGEIEGHAHVAQGATLHGNGTIRGELSNDGSLYTDSGDDRTLRITGSFSNRGLVALTLTDSHDFDRIKVGGIATLGGSLVVLNRGEGLAAGEVARIIAADTFVGEFDTFEPLGFSNGVLFDDATGKLIGMAGGSAGSSEHYLNLNSSQTQIYFSLYEDSVEIGAKNVIAGGGSVAKRAAPGTPVASQDGSVTFTSGPMNGDAQLVDILNLVTFTDPGTILEDVIDHLSPEVHRGMADYTEMALRSQVRQAAAAAPVSRSGNTQVFASLHSSTAGVDSTASDAGYDLQMSGFTTGVRHDIDKRTRIGGLLGADDGSIQGALVDTDARGIVVGGFAQYLVHEKSRTTLTAGLVYGGHDFDAKRYSFAGPVRADDISSDAVEFTLGASTVVYEKNGLRVSPHGSLSYIGGHVDDFTEKGTGVPLKVGSQDIDTVLLDLGVDVEYKVHDRVTLAGNLGYVTDFGNSSEDIAATFAASGASARPFSVSSPGIDDDAVVIGLGVYYDFTETIRAGLNYRGDLGFDSKDAQSIGVSASFAF
ncbi:MAG: autotransporter domain-containing protein [Verrucomicrobiota bacterium]